MTTMKVTNTTSSPTTTCSDLCLFRQNAETFPSETRLLNSAIILCFVFGAAIIPTNLLMFSYFGRARSRLNKIFRFMFRCLNGIDVMVGVAALIQAITRLQIKYRVSKLWEESVEVSLVVLYFTSNIAFRMSIFVNAMIALSRMYYILYPIRAKASLKIRKIRTCILIYLMVNITFFIIDMCFIYMERYATEQKYRIHQAFVVGKLLPMLFNLPFGSGIARFIMGWYNEQYYIYCNMIFLGIGYVLPAFIVLFTLPFQIYRILRTKVRGQKTHRRARRRIAKVICLLSITFFVCNTAFLTHVFVQEFYIDVKKRKDNDFQAESVEDSNRYPLFFSEKIAAFLTSLLNPLILSRSKTDVLHYVKSVIKCDNRNDPETVTQTMETEGFTDSRI